MGLGAPQELIGVLDLPRELLTVLHQHITVGLLHTHTKAYISLDPYMQIIELQPAKLIM